MRISGKKIVMVLLLNIFSLGIRARRSPSLPFILLMVLLLCSGFVYYVDRTYPEQSFEQAHGNWHCPNCGESYYMDGAGWSTAAYFPPIWKDGADIQTGHNRSGFKRICLNCDKEYEITDEGIYELTREAL